MKIAVIGSGSWGTALAIILGKKGYGINLWGRDSELLSNISRCSENVRYLPGIKLPQTISTVPDLNQAVKDTDAVVLALPSSALRENICKLDGVISSNTLLIHAGKGLEQNTGLRGSQVITDVLGEAIGSRCVALSGPNLAVELANDIPTATIVASACPDCAILAQDIFASNFLRVYRNPDIIGVELGGALKNVMGIGAGICDGLGFGDNTKATLVTRGLMEITRLGVLLGANGRTFTGLSGIGDLMATCASKLSRNLRLGTMLGQGHSIEESLQTLGQVAEGYYTCQAAYELSKEKDVYMPITEQIYAVLFENKSPKEAVHDLMARDKKDELC